MPSPCRIRIPQSRNQKTLCTRKPPIQSMWFPLRVSRPFEADPGTDRSTRSLYYNQYSIVIHNPFRPGWPPAANRREWAAYCSSEQSSGKASRAFIFISRLPSIKSPRRRFPISPMVSPDPLLVSGGMGIIQKASFRWISFCLGRIGVVPTEVIVYQLGI